MKQIQKSNEELRIKDYVIDVESYRKKEEKIMYLG